MHLIIVGGRGHIVLVSHTHSRYNALIHSVMLSECNYDLNYALSIYMYLRAGTSPKITIIRKCRPSVAARTTCQARVHVLMLS